MTTTQKRPRRKPVPPMAIAEAVDMILTLEAAGPRPANGTRANQVLRAASRVYEAYRDAIQDNVALEKQAAEWRNVAAGMEADKRNLEEHLAIARKDSAKLTDNARRAQAELDGAIDETADWRRYANRCEALAKHLAEFITEPGPQTP